MVPEEAAVRRPCASTVMDANVYEPAVTAVLAKSTVTVEPMVLAVTPFNPLITLVTGAAPLLAAVMRPC